MASISCLLWLIGVAQGAAPADCSGSSCLPRSSLLQVKSKARRQSASLETHSSLKEQLAQYTKFTEDLVAKYGEDPTPEAANKSSSDDVTDEEREAVRTVLQFIDDMYASLLGWHEADVETAAKCTSQHIVRACQPNSTISGAISNIKIDVDELAQNHEECRNRGYSLCPQFPPQCPDYDNYRKDLSPYHGQVNDAKVPSSPLRTLPSCVSPPTGAFADASIKTTDMEQLQTMEDCLRQTKSWLDPLYKKYKDCERQEDTCQQVCPDCNREQQIFEAKHCEWYSYLSATCSEVQSCGSEETSLCNTECKNIEVRESARIADNETGQRLVCLLHVIFGKPKDVHDENTAWDPRPNDDDRPKALAECKQNPYTTPDWNIECDPGSWTSPEPCDHFDIPTCSDQFQTTWYVNKGLHLPCAGGCECQEQAFGKHVDECTLSTESRGTCNV